MMMPSTAPIKKTKKKSSMPAKSIMLKHMGIDYLQQFSKKYGENIDNYFAVENISQILILIEKVLLDSSKTEAIEISIAFYLLYFRSISSAFMEASQEVFRGICGRNKIHDNVAWVRYFLPFFLPLISCRGMKN